MTVPGNENDPRTFSIILTGNQGKIPQKYIFCTPYFYEFEDTFHFTGSPYCGELTTFFFRKKYPGYFYHFKDTLEFYPLSPDTSLVQCSVSCDVHPLNIRLSQPLVVSVMSVVTLTHIRWE